MESDQKNKFIYLNKKFYDEHSISFSLSRNFSDPVWDSVFNDFNPHKTPLSILDLGCGNGRFLDYFSKKFPNCHVEYLGVDQSGEMLRIAREKFKNLKDVSFQESTISYDYIENLDRNFDMVLALGILHHFPQRRLDFVIQLCEILKNQGISVVSLWNFENIPKDKKTQLVHFADDYLLSWQGEKDKRYCHSFSSNEVEEICSSIKLKGYKVNIFKVKRKNGTIDYFLKIKNNI